MAVTNESPEPDRQAILNGWQEAIIATYSKEAHQYLRKGGNRFGNPIGQAILRATEEVVQYLFSVTEGGYESIALNELIGIRAVQDFTPSCAVGIFGELKAILHRNIGSIALSKEQAEKYTCLMGRIDEIQLIAFDLYVVHRQRLADIRVNEFRRRYARVLNDSRFLSAESLIEETSGQDIPAHQNYNGAAL